MLIAVVPFHNERFKDGGRHKIWCECSFQLQTIRNVLLYVDYVPQSLIYPNLLKRLTLLTVAVVPAAAFSFTLLIPYLHKHREQLRAITVQSKKTNKKKKKKETEVQLSANVSTWASLFPQNLSAEVTANTLNCPWLQEMCPVKGVQTLGGTLT